MQDSKDGLKKLPVKRSELDEEEVLLVTQDKWTINEGDEDHVVRPGVGDPVKVDMGLDLTFDMYCLVYDRGEKNDNVTTTIIGQGDDPIKCFWPDKKGASVLAVRLRRKIFKGDEPAYVGMLGRAYISPDASDVLTQLKLPGKEWEAAGCYSRATIIVNDANTLPRSTWASAANFIFPKDASLLFDVYYRESPGVTPESPLFGIHTTHGSQNKKKEEEPGGTTVSSGGFSAKEILALQNQKGTTSSCGKYVTSPGGRQYATSPSSSTRSGPKSPGGVTSPQALEKKAKSPQGADLQPSEGADGAPLFAMK